MALAVDRHPQRQKIIEMILAGQTLRAIAAAVTPKISYMAVQRYKDLVVRPTVSGRRLSTQSITETIIRDNGTCQTVTIADRAPTEAAMSPVRSRVEKLWGSVERGIKVAEEKGKLAELSSLVNSGVRTVETLGQLTGELTNQAQQPAPAMIRMLCFPGGGIAIEATNTGVSIESASTGPETPVITLPDTKQP